MYEFWGNALENLPKAAKEIHRKKGVFFYGEWGAISPQQAVYELGVVSYPRDGDYTDTKDYVPFHDLPDVEEVATEEQRKNTSPPGQGWWPVIALKYDCQSKTETKILIVCWYQLLHDGRVVAWWITQKNQAYGRMLGN